MKLILFRHAVAIDRDEASHRKIEDDKRPLTKAGISKCEKVVKRFLKYQPEIDKIVCSPLLRSRQTAEIIARAYKKRQISQSSELIPSAPPMAFAQWLKVYAKNSTTILAVGHEPHLSVFASWCLAGMTDSIVEIKKSGIVGLELESFDQIGPRSVSIEYLLQPKFF